MSVENIIQWGGIGLAIITAILCVMFRKDIENFGQKLKKMRKNNDFSITMIKKKKPDSQKSFNDKFGNSKPDVSSSIRENMKNINKMLRVFDLRSPIYNKKLFCGCKAKDKLIVELCQSHRQQYIVMMYDPPEGYYISDDVIF